MEKKHLFTYTFLILISTILFTVLYILSPFLKPILWAIIFSTITYPLYRLIEMKLRTETLSAAIMTFILIFLFIVPLSIIATIVLKELVQISKTAIHFYKGKSIAEIIQKCTEIPLIGPIFKHIPKNLISSKDITGLIISNVKALANFSALQLKSIIVGTGSAIIKFFIFIFTYAFLLKDGEKFIHYLKKLMPLEEQDKEDILNNIYVTTLSVVYGTVGTALVQGSVGIILYYIFSIPYPFVWGFATAYASFIPPLGASMVWFPLSIYLFFKVSTIKGILLAMCGLCLISSLDNILKPLIMKNRVNTPYIILFFSIFGGLIKFGFIGMFLGPILFNLLFTMAGIYEERFLKNP